MPAKISPLDYVKKVRKIHGKSITVLSDYIKCDTPVKFKCNECDYIWETKPIYVSQGSRCPRCTGKIKITQEEYVRKVAISHGDMVTVIGKYKHNMSKVKHLCSKCNKYFYARPSDVQRGTGCYSCSNTLSIDEYKARIKKIHKGKITLHSGYVNTQVKCFHYCSVCKSKISKYPYNLLRGGGCYVCQKANHSKVAISWLKEIAKRYSIYIQHAENLGEYKIPGTKYRCDGYHKESNTVFEFNGDCFHGNPKVYKKSDKPHPFNDLTALQLYRNTKNRENKIKELGYNVCSIWESDYRNLDKKSRSIITI
jgi:uncharacterized C2H2 Zn-finger protein